MSKHRIASRGRQARRRKSPPPGQLWPSHRERLIEHYGLSPRTIMAGRFWSAESAQAGELLGWEGGGPGTGIVIPYASRNGFFRFRRDQPAGSRKYESPKGQSQHLYFLPVIRKRLADQNVPLLITEGEFKAARAIQAGFCAIGLPGVSGWSQPRTDDEKARRKPRELRSDFDAIALEGRSVFIVFDSDVLNKRPVCWEEWFLAEALRRRRATVRCVRLPEGSDGAKVGLDDFLNRFGKGGPDELRALLEQAGDVERPDFSLANFRLIEVIDERTGRPKRVAVPIPLQKIRAAARRLTGDWPRRCGGALFVCGDEQVDWIENPPQLFGFLHAVTEGDGVRWRDGPGFVTKPEFHAEALRQATKYDGVEIYPHVPPMPRTFYVPRSAAKSSGNALSSLVDRFCPETPPDRELIKAAIITPLWGGPPGQRPGFAIDSDAGDCGRGVGKTRLAMMIAELYGGAFLIGESEDREKLLKRLLTPTARTKRVAIIDNAKARLSSSDVESLITCKTLSGYANYIGEAERFNTLTWFLTANGFELSKDLAQRVVVIRLGRPVYSATWEQDSLALIERDRESIFADIAGILTARHSQLERFSRWGAWEGAVLAAMADPAVLQALIEERQRSSDSDADLADTVLEFFRFKLHEAGYRIDSATLIRIPTATAAAWYIEGTGEQSKPITAARRLRKAFTGRWEIQPDPSRRYGRCFLFCGSPEAIRGIAVYFDPTYPRYSR